jgi:hypothetical protein
MRAAPNAHAPPLAPIGRRGPHATPDEKISPSPRPASTATDFGCLRAKPVLFAEPALFAEIEFAGPLSVSLARIFAKPTVYQREYCQRVPERPCRKENHPDVTCFTKGLAGLPYISEMTQKTLPSPLDPKADIRTDYALILTGVGAALLALIYLILI